MLKAQHTATATSRNSLPVTLLLAIDANLSKEHGGKQANVPCDHVKPEWRVQGWACGELGELCADLCGEGTEKGCASESSNWNGGWHGPSAQAPSLHR